MIYFLPDIVPTDEEFFEIPICNPDFSLLNSSAVYVPSPVITIFGLKRPRPVPHTHTRTFPVSTVLPSFSGRV